MFWEVTNRRADEKTISYAESHDQALVGDKTIIFALIDADMYWHMQKGDENYTVHRGIALHKRRTRLLTASTINGRLPGTSWAMNSVSSGMDRLPARGQRMVVQVCSPPMGSGWTILTWPTTSWAISDALPCCRLSRE